MSRLRQAWLVLIGRLDLPSTLLNRISFVRMELRAADQRIFELERDLTFAKAGVAELRGKFNQLGGEAKIKSASDAIGDSIIDDMKKNPSKYIPKAE